MSSDNPSACRTSTGAADREEKVKVKGATHKGKNIAFHFVYADALEQQVGKASHLPPARCLCCSVAKGT